MPSAATTRARNDARPPRGEARRAAITEAALTVIARVGPDNLTHRAVAAEAGLPLAATTYWFSNKEDMVRAALEHAAERDIAYWERLRDASRGWTADTLADELTTVIEDSCTTRRECAVVDCALWLEAVRRPELRDVAQRWLDAYAEIMASILDHVGAPSTPDDADLLGSVVDGLIGHQLGATGPFDRALVTSRLRRLVTALAA
ncbi:MAG TPA: TetR family transcriptional regulator [Baekduia sp.]|uniref:TetR/AcrR family transcriptional regulator n=1 Tax=Baekduia sp. TaxID=2600305 RepID=UPI002D78F444|nr:TetR family transcriptional regulator [Baekduia sp.]HET6510203.1 TetR family transcriptional regulator [Baekduia sp.]